ncbi:aspartate/glutamate racemase family protein [Pandoraea sp.]|uniref:aspartate/glutamate racemase family protein n=1 Tax=Pandoraea sp. TaxID=1883445 RepID=UPI0035B0F4AA
MREILLVNPNTSAETTSMMVDIARAVAPPDYRVSGATAARGVPMIVNAERLDAAGYEVVQSWRSYVGKVDGVIIGAFGDPGIHRLRSLAKTPVVGICEASILEASQGDRRFGIATVTPDLVEPIDAKVRELGVANRYTGVRLTCGDPLALAGNARALEDALAHAVTECVERDGAQAVVIGGGPLGQAAIGLANRFSLPIIAPIPAAMRRLVKLLANGSTM